MRRNMGNIAARTTVLALLLAVLMFQANTSAAETQRAADAPANAKEPDSSDADRGQAVLQMRAQEMVDAHEERMCERAGTVRYHGQCMAPEDRSILFETEIRHVESLLQEALTQYETADAQTLAQSFRELDEFVNTFGPREVMDERLTEKLILVLGYLYRPAERIDAELKRGIEKSNSSDDLLEFLDSQERLAAFSEQVRVPLLQLFGQRMDDYVVRYGYARFARLLKDNGLADVLEELQSESPR